MSFQMKIFKKLLIKVQNFQKVELNFGVNKNQFILGKKSTVKVKQEEFIYKIGHIFMKKKGNLKREERIKLISLLNIKEYIHLL